MKTHGLGPAVGHFLTQKWLTEVLWLGLAILWWLMNLLEDPNDDTDDRHMDMDASRCLWAVYYGRRPDLISLGCIHLLVPLNCALGVLSDGPYNAADVVNLLKTSVRKGDTEEDFEWRSVMHWASTGQSLFQQQESPDHGGDADSSEEIEEVTDPQTPKPKGKTDKQRQKEQDRAQRELRKQEEARERQRKMEEKEKEKQAKEDKRANRKRNEEEDKLATAAAGASPSQKKKGQSRASRLPCNVASGLPYPRATDRATASEWRPQVPLGHGCRWTITDILPLTQTV